MLFNFHNPNGACNHPYNLRQKFVPLFQSICTCLFHPYLFTKSPLQSPLTVPSNLSNFSPSRFFTYNHSNNLHQKHFPHLSKAFIQFKLCQRTRELGSLVKNDLILISPFFLKVWTMITGLTITDFLSLRLRKLVYCRQQSLMEMLGIGVTNYSIHPLLYPQSIVMTAFPYPSYITRTPIPLETTCLT